MRNRSVRERPEDDLQVLVEVERCEMRLAGSQTSDLGIAKTANPMTSVFGSGALGKADNRILHCSLRFFFVISH